MGCRRAVPEAYLEVETTTDSAGAGKIQKGWCTRKKREALEGFEGVFRWLGCFIFDHAKAFIGGALFVVALATVALLFIKFETRADLLYALPASQARSDLAKLVSLYGTPPRVNMVFVVSRKGEYVLTPPVLRKLHNLDEYIKRHLVIPPRRRSLKDSQEILPRITYEDVCHRMTLPEVDFSAVSDLDWDTVRRRLQTNDAPCNSIGPIDLYRNQKQFGVPLATRNWPYIPNIAHNKIVKADLALTDPLVHSLPSGTTRLMNATGFLFIYHTVSDKRGLGVSLEWEAALIDFVNHEIKPHAALDRIDSSRFVQLRREKQAYDSDHLTLDEREALVPGSVTRFNDHDWQDFQVFVNAQRSWQDELGRSTSLDSRLMRDYAMAYFIIAVYMIVVNRTNNIVRSKSLCGWIGSLSALFGFCVGGGVCYWLGLRHTPTMHAAPFLVLAIGLDNTFVVLNFYTLAHAYKDNPRTRCSMSLANAGISITITTFTSIISFLVGAAGPYLAVRNFCYVTAMGLLGGYIMNIVFFFPFLCLESVAEARGQPFFVPLPPFILRRFALPTQTGCALKDPFGGSSSLPALTYTAKFAKTSGLTPPTSPRSGLPPFQPHATQGVGELQRIHRLYRHRQVMAGFKTGSSDVFDRHEDGSSPPSSSDEQHSQGPSADDPLSQGSIVQEFFRAELLHGRSIFELASVRWKFTRRHALIRGEMERRRLLDRRTGAVGCRGPLTPAAAESLQCSGHEYLLESEVSTIPDVVLPSIYKVAKFAAAEADEPEGTVGKVSRGVFLHVLGPALCRRRVQTMMMLALLTYVGVSVFGALTYLSAGLDLENLTPPDSYLREAFELSHDKFPIFPYETNLFFTAPDIAQVEDKSIAERTDLLQRYGSNHYGTRRASDLKPLTADSLAAHEGNTAGMAEQMSPFWDSLGEVQWWEPRSVVSFVEIDRRLREMKTTQDVLNGLLLFYNENAARLFGNASMPAEERRLLFHGALYRWLKSGIVGQHVRDQFRFADPHPNDPQGLPRLLGVRLIIFNYNFLNSFEQSRYMVEIRKACDDVSVNWNEIVLNGTSIPRTLQTYVQESKLQSKRQISDPSFSLPKAPPPPYPVVPDHMEESSRLPAGFTATAFMETFLFFESDITILRSTIVNMSTAFVAIVLVSSLLMRGVGTAALVTAMICLVDLGIVGFMGLWRIHLNILSMILLVLSIGFSVDYTVHVVHTFTHCLGRTRRDKMVETLILMCNPVTHGAISTFLGILPIVFRREFVMETFFKMTVLVVAFGFLNGVVFLPVILAIRGPVFNSTKVESEKLTREVRKTAHSLFNLKHQAKEV